ncbi:hypothetical protein J7E96_28215 [Streptomyces sp. ISL-96]|uniref:hypothetical protein n=1 Tax=Streptomyces sp. ISL-96 TaxID=2819191 RepID=UPI001BEB9D71|nr:hypothetical protein [Streptomyces sp. ISL-96]MBT2492325.1 hypothetical protein [Streptomyces sp. ISL-96]
MTDAAVVVVAAACCSGLVSAAACLLVPAVQGWRRTHSAAPAVSPADHLAADLAALGDADALDFFLCPRSQRSQPHAVHADGSRRCWHCGHDSPGDQ